MLAVVADLRQDIAGFLRIGRFRESEREGGLRFYSSDSLPHIVAATGGFSEDEADRGVGELISRFSPYTIVSAGLATSTRDGLSPGDIILCDRILSVNGPAYSWRKSDAPEIETDSVLIERIRSWLTATDIEFEVGGCLTVPQFVAKPPMKEWLGETFSAAAMGMDGYSVAAAVREIRPRLRCVPVRVIMDTVEQDVSPRMFENLRHPPARRILRSAGYVSGNPVRLFEVAGLASQARLARRSLARFLYRLARTQIAMGRN